MKLFSKIMPNTGPFIPADKHRYMPDLKKNGNICNQIIWTGNMPQMLCVTIQSVTKSIALSC